MYYLFLPDSNHPCRCNFDPITKTWIQPTTVCKECTTPSITVTFTTGDESRFPVPRSKHGQYIKLPRMYTSEDINALTKNSL